MQKPIPVSCATRSRAGIITVSSLWGSRLLGRRSTVGHRALDAVIGVRIPTSQPDFARPSGELRLGRPLAADEPERAPNTRSLSRRSLRDAQAKADLSFRAPHSIRRAQHLRTSRSIPRACFRIPNSPRWPKTCHCDPHARHWRSICLCPSKRQRSIAALRRPRYGRRRTTWVAQRGAVWLHPSAPTLVDRRIVGVSGRTRRGALREVPQVRFWPRVRDQAFRTIARRRVVARVHRARTAPS